MDKSILILGAYGGAGQALASELLSHLSVEVILSGRNESKLLAFCTRLTNQFPGAKISTMIIDTSNKDQLIVGFKSAFLAVVTTTKPEHMPTILEAAIATRTHIVDIFVRSDIVEKLASWNSKLADYSILWISQAGFHPGLIAPSIRHLASRFDRMDTAEVFMAMDPVFYTPESVHEIIFEVGRSSPLILEKGEWRKGGYKDMKSMHFPQWFGRKSCYPLKMMEIRHLDVELGLVNCGVYAAGFNPFIDYVVFSLVYILGKINIPLSQKVGGRLMYWGRKKGRGLRPRVEFIVHASGVTNGRQENLSLTIHSEDGYMLTARSIVACLHKILKMEDDPGIHLMGECVDSTQLLKDLKSFGVQYYVG